MWIPWAIVIKTGHFRSSSWTDNQLLMVSDLKLVALSFPMRFLFSAFHSLKQVSHYSCIRSMETFRGSFIPSPGGGVTGLGAHVRSRVEWAKKERHGAQISKGNLIHVRQPHVDIWPVGEKGGEISHKKNEQGCSKWWIISTWNYAILAVFFHFWIWLMGQDFSKYVYNFIDCFP